MTRSRLRHWRAWMASAVWAITSDAFASLWAGETLPVLLKTSLVPGELAGPHGSSGGRLATEQTPQVAVLSIHGPMVTRDTSTSDDRAISYELIGAALQSVLERDDVGAILLDLNTPGGHVAGCDELATQIAAWSQQKPIVALANPLTASAGLWLASAASEFVATPSATVGSLGVLSQHFDVSRLLKSMGVKVTTIQSVPHKDEGSPYAPLSASAKAEVQRRVDLLHQRFADAMARNRHRDRAHVDAHFGQGRVLFADDALRVGMIDRIATPEAVISGLRSQLASRATGHSLITAQASPGGLVLATTAGVVASPPAPPVSPRVEYVRMEITAELRAALVSRGFVPQDASDDVCRAAINTYCHVRGVAIPTVATAMLALFAAALPSAAAPQVIPPAAAAPVAAAPVAVPAPVPAPAVAAAVPLSPERPTAQDLLAQVQLTGLDAGQRMTLMESLSPQLASMTHGSLSAAINQHLVTLRQPAGATVNVTADETDRFMADARNQLLGRALTSESTATWTNPVTGQQQTWNRSPRTALASLPRMLERAFIVNGVSAVLAADLIVNPVRLFSVMNGNIWGTGISAQAATNVRSMYQNIFLDAANVILRRSYDTAEVTYQRWCRRDENFTDFKPRNSVILGELPSPKVIPENGEFEEVQTVDGKETWAVNVWGFGFSQSWQMTVDDNLGAFSANNVKMAAAMRRKQNQLAYNILKANPLLSDGVALFGTRNSVANTRTGYAAPSHDSLTAGFKAFGEKKGLNTEAAVSLNLTPRYMICPFNLREPALTVLGSRSKVGQSNSGVTNIYENSLELVVDNEIGAGSDNGSDTTHYLATASNQADSLVYAFLNGTESPVVESMMSFDTLGARFRMYQVFGATALDHRGLERFQS